MLVTRMGQQLVARTEADRRLAGRGKMIGALDKLERMHRPADLPKALSAFGISGGGDKSWKRFLATHPPLSDRIAALKRVG